MSGRQAEAARNDQRILSAARALLAEDPAAPIAAVAERAGVGIGALYRRYGSKEGLIERLSLDGVQRCLAEAETALANDGDAWEVFCRFMRNSLDAGAFSLTVHFAGAFTPSEELSRTGREAYEATHRLLERAKAAGALRSEIEVGDLSLLFEQVQTIRLGDEERTRQLRHRYLTILLEGMRVPAIEPLPGPAPSWDEFRGRYNRS